MLKYRHPFVSKQDLLGSRLRFPVGEAGAVVEDLLFTPDAGGGITGTATTSQAQTISASGSFALSAVSGAIATSQAQTLSAAGSFVPLAVSGVITTLQAQSATATGLFATGGISGTVATSQAQAVSGTGTVAPQTVSGIGSTSQSQRIAATGATAPQAASGAAATSQAQTVSGTGSANPQAVSGVSETAQAQTINASGSFAALAGVSGIGSASQAQTSSGAGNVVNPDAPASTGAGRGSREHHGMAIDVQIEQRKALEVIAKVAIKQVEKPRSESHRKQQLAHEIAKADLGFNAFYVDLLDGARSQVLTEQIRAEFDSQRLDPLYLQSLIAATLIKKVEDDDAEAICALMLLL